MMCVMRAIRQRKWSNFLSLLSLSPFFLFLLYLLRTHLYAFTSDMEMMMGRGCMCGGAKEEEDETVTRTSVDESRRLPSSTSSLNNTLL
jgi:hypothetical protein